MTNSNSTRQSSNTPEVVFNTHKFIYSLYHNNQIKGHVVEFENRDNKLEKIEIQSVEIGASPISAKFYDLNHKRYIIPFFRIKRIYFQGELVWDDSQNDSSNSKIIKGY